MSHTTTTLDALEELVEVFMGLSGQLDWATSEDISRKELMPIFSMCANKKLSPEQALDVVISNMTVKRDETFTVMLQIVQRLNKQLSEYNLVRKENGKAVSGDEPA